MTDWNTRNAKKRQKPTPRMHQIGTRGKPAPDLDAIAKKADEYYDEPTFSCPDCLDTGFVMTTRRGPGKVYGKAEHPVTYSARCRCHESKRKWVPQPKGHDEIPI